MNKNFKLIIGGIYIICFGLLIFAVFSYLDLKDLTDLKFIKNNTIHLLDYKNENLVLTVILFFTFSIIWILLLGFGAPLAIISGFIFGKWYGTIISIVSLTTGCTLLYIFANFYFKEIIERHLEKKISKFKYLFKKREFFYFMIFRLTGGGGIPFAIQNVIPVLFNMKTKNYFFASLYGLAPMLFIINSLGSGIEKLIAKNEGFSYLMIITDPGIYIPIISFLLILIISYFIKRKLFTNN